MTSVQQPRSQLHPMALSGGNMRLTETATCASTLIAGSKSLMARIYARITTPSASAVIVMSTEVQELALSLAKEPGRSTGTNAGDAGICKTRAVRRMRCTVGQPSPFKISCTFPSVGMLELFSAEGSSSGSSRESKWCPR